LARTVTPTRRSFARIWARAKKEIGDVVPADIHFHDLRHSGNHFAASRAPILASLLGRERLLLAAAALRGVIAGAARAIVEWILDHTN
jgi:integrase